MDAGKSIGETIRESETEFDAQQLPAEPSTTGQEASQVSEGIETLDKDETFQKEVNAMAQELGQKLSFGQTKRFKELYWKNREAERKLKELETAQVETNQSEKKELSEEDIVRIAKEKGYQLSKPQAEKVADEFEQLIADAETPEQKEWLKKHYNLIVGRIAKDLSPFVNEVNEMIVERRLEKSEKSARNLIADMNKKYGLTLDYDKDIEPELLKMVQANPKFNKENADIYQLTKEYLADKGIELGRKISLKEQQDVTLKKKQANVETTVGGGGQAGIPDSKKSLKEIFMESANQHGLNKF